MKRNIIICTAFLWVSILFSQEPINDNTTICWDVSKSMTDRDLEKDFSVLAKVFEKNGNQEIQLLLFGIGVEERTYTLKDGNWTQLKKDLEGIQYDGATVYSNLAKNIKNANVYVFTDGRKLLSKDILSLTDKSYLINSCPDRDASFLERTALLNRSRLMDFAALLPQNTKNSQKKTTPSRNDVEKQMIRGTVYIDNKPASNVRVAVKGFSDSFLTDFSGNFSVDAQVGDTLVVTSRDSRTLQIVPIEVMAHTNVFMSANIVALQEVVVMEKKLERIETMTTGYGLQEKEKIGYTISTVEEKDISMVETTATDVLNTKVSGLSIKSNNAVGGEGGLSQAEIRGRNTINMNPYALVVVNGVPMDRSSRSTNMRTGASSGSYAAYDFIDPGNIAKITVLKGLAATNAYGSEGANGVILITTKTAVDGNKNKTKQKKDLALLQNNVYNQEESRLVAQTISGLEALKKSDSVEEAFKSYLVLRGNKKRSPLFYLEVFDYFKDKDPRIAKKVISNILEDDPKNLESIKMVALALATVGDFKNVIHLNEEIIKRSPNDVNAYFNKAVAKLELGQTQGALNELMALSIGNTYFSVNGSSISKTLDREIKNLIHKHRNKLDLSNFDSKYLNNLKYKVRLVFEWNRPGAEFELQFVNPQNRFFNWEHTNMAIKTRLEDEIKNNYRIEEYEFYGDVAGKWVINAKYLGDTIVDNEAPLALKCTVFKDFGYASQSKEEVLVHFSREGEKKSIKILEVH